MKRPLQLLLILSCLFSEYISLQAGKDFLGANWESYSGFQVSTQAVLPEKETHPSLWFYRNGLKEFKETLDDDATIRTFWEKVKNHPLLHTPFPEVIPPDQLWVPELASANRKRIHKKLLGSIIKTGNQTDIFLKSHSHKSSRKADIALDGDFAWISLESNQLAKAAGQSVKRLSFKDKPVVTSEHRISFALKLDRVIELGVAIEEPTAVTIYTRNPITSVTLNGDPIPFETTDEGVTFALNSSGNYFLQ